MAWIGVDLDGTLAHYEGWNGGAIGEPIPLMVERVKAWLAEGKEVRIFTARVNPFPGECSHQRSLIHAWCEKHIGERLKITCMKDFEMVELWDDRAIQVIKNTGERVG